MEVLGTGPNRVPQQRAPALAGAGEYPSSLAWALTDAACAGWMVLLALLVRGVTFIPSVINPDESLYILQAREWLRGGWPLGVGDRPWGTGNEPRRSAAPLLS